MEAWTHWRLPDDRHVPARQAPAAPPRPAKTLKLIYGNPVTPISYMLDGKHTIRYEWRPQTTPGFSRPRRPERRDAQLPPPAPGRAVSKREFGSNNFRTAARR